MSLAFKLVFLAPVPVGHRVQLLYSQHWTSPFFGGEPHWENLPDPIVVDLETGIVYCDASTVDLLVASPLGYKPNVGRQVSRTTEGRVTSCVVSSRGGDNTELHTMLTLEPEPHGYR